MEAEQPPSHGSTINKTSGIPRPTRLPVLKSSLPRPQAASLSTNAANLSSQTLKTRSSVSTFTPPSQPSQPLKARPPPASKPSGSSSLSRAPTRKVPLHTSGVKPVSRESASRPAASKPIAYPEDAENHDQLSSLDSFRAASRQSSHEDQVLSAESAFATSETQALPRSPKKQSRPSLSNRTIDSIANLPSTPKDRRRSSFFSPAESPMGPPPRPNSRTSRNGSNASNSRPNTSDGMGSDGHATVSVAALKAPSSTKSAIRSSIGGLGGTRRSLSSAFQIQDDPVGLQQRSDNVVPAGALSPAAYQRSTTISKARPVSKTVAAKPSRARPSLSETFGPAVREIKKDDEDHNREAARSQGPSFDATNNSSTALRQQIAAARAAARKAQTTQGFPTGVSSGDQSQSGVSLHVDPFNQAPKDGKHILRNRIKTARTDGRLNIAALELKEIPHEVMEMYNAAVIEDSGVSWAELVDLTRLNAADNEIEKISDAIFPDKSMEDFDMDDQSQGNQFAGLEMLDLHGNRLASLPIGVRRFERLTTLNLSHNKLDNSALDVVSQITCLKDLKLGHNSISGALPTSLYQLQRLETLDLRSNRLLSLPNALRELVSLKVLNVSGNQLTALPMDALAELRLVELDASNNALITSLFSVGSPDVYPTLQTLNVANNSLAALTFDGDLQLPQLHTLDVTCNHLTSLPSLSAWTNLTNLLAGDNKITSLPDGFTSLRKLRNVNLTGNELRVLDPEIAHMESLESLILASNPLRERKLLTMNAQDIKHNLRARLGGAEPVQISGQAVSQGSQVAESPSWVVGPNGLLSLCERNLLDNMDDNLGSFLKEHAIKRLLLQANKLTTIPPALAMATFLKMVDLSGNPFSMEYLSNKLNLLSIQELNLSRCGIRALEPLTTYLEAPELRILNISANRLTGELPPLRRSYPELSNLVAHDNKITHITAESLRGFNAVNLASNSIEQVPPEIGLLWDEGLKSLVIGSNAFRVPNYRVLEKGTEATMRWLRDRIPARPEEVE